jgi:hypothetical protein
VAQECRPGFGRVKARESCFGGATPVRFGGIQGHARSEPVFDLVLACGRRARSMLGGRVG